MDDVETLCRYGMNGAGGIDPIFGLEVEKFVEGPMFHIDGLVYDGTLSTFY